MYEPRVLRQIWEQRGPELSSGSAAAHSSMSDGKRVERLFSGVRFQWGEAGRWRAKPTYGLVVSREAHIFVALWVGGVSLENEGESVARRQEGLGTRMIPISGILTPTKLIQNFTLIEHLKEHVFNISW